MTQPTVGEVHCWSVNLAAECQDVTRMSDVLSEDERVRAARFACERDRQRFVVAHAALREILAGYLDTDPSAIRLVGNALGKPALSPELGPNLKFNLSHSADLALIAVATDAEVGIDVEYVRREVDHADVAQAFFSATELAELNALSGPARAEGFFRMWTTREACAKASGEGLSAFDRAPSAAPDPRWSLFPLRPVPDYIGALAVESDGNHRLSYCLLPATTRLSTHMV